jgi:hypothetical protein
VSSEGRRAAPLCGGPFAGVIGGSPGLGLTGGGPRPGGVGLVAHPRPRRPDAALRVSLSQHLRAKDPPAQQHPVEAVAPRQFGAAAAGGLTGRRFHPANRVPVFGKGNRSNETPGRRVSEGMAESTKKSKPRSARKAKSGSGGKSRSKAAKSPGSATKSASAKATKANGAKAVGTAKGAPIGPAANAALAGQAALAGTKAAGQAVGLAASKAKVPIVAGGGMIVGVAGGLAVLRRRNGRASQATLDLDRIVAAARRAGSFGEELGRAASMLEQAGAGSKRK